MGVVPPQRQNTTRWGKNFALTFAALKQSFPEARKNFLASLVAHPELKSRLANEFWFGGEKIYELYEVVQSCPNWLKDESFNRNPLLQ